jgi:ribonuclease HI
MKVEKLIVVSDACCKVPDAHIPGRIGVGKCACGVIYLNGSKEEKNKIKSIGQYLGEMTVPEAEYNGLIFALDNASDICRWDLEIWLDSQLVIKHLNNEYKLKAKNLKPLFDKVRSLENRFKSVMYFHHDRENQLAKIADSIAHDYLVKFI